MAPRSTNVGNVPQPVVVAGGTASTTAASVAGVLLGFSARETAGATAGFRVHDGQASSGAWLALGTLAPGESVRDWFGPTGLPVATGLFVERLSGTTEFVFYEG